MRTIEELTAQFSGRFTFEVTQQRGMVCCKVTDTQKQRTQRVVGPTLSIVADEVEHACQTVVNNDSN